MSQKEKAKILIVDDSPANIDIIGGSLIGFQLLIALNGERALELAKTIPVPDLILLDVMMPGIDGFEVCKRLKDDPRTRDIPIIFLTARTDTDSIIRGFELGANDYITKPFNTKELVTRVNTYLSLKQAWDDNQKYLSEIEYKNRLITESFEYAKRLQEATLPSELILQSELTEHFILLIPKDIISGDFFWFKEINGTLIIIAADCTGHGISGAFVSMFGIAYLNEIVNSETIMKPDVILNTLRNRIIEMIGHSDIQEKEGMDMAIVTLNRERKFFRFAGAHRPLYLIRDDQLTIIKGDNMLVGFSDQMSSFTSHKIKLQVGDAIYLFSDGFPDQFGGPERRKFKYPRFREMLLQNHMESMKKQREIYEKAFMDWKGNSEQIDDVIVLGFRA